MNFRHLLLAATAMALPALAIAQPITGPYISGGAGVNFLQNYNTNAALGYASLVPSATYRFDVGFAGQAAVGFGLGNGARLEVEGNYSNNHVRNVGFSTPVRSGGLVQQYGVFVNGIYDFDLGLPVTPYIGAGVGYQEVELNGVNFGPPDVVVPTRNRNRGTFGYQGIAGVSYALDDLVPGLALTAEFRFVGVLPQTFGQTTVTDGVAVNTQTDFSDSFNYQGLLGLRYAFYTPPPPPAVIPVAAPAPTPARTYLVFFDWDKADLTTRARQIVAEAAQASTRVQTTRIEVNGHTDLSGTAQYNLGLSVRRAKAVQGELIRDGVPASAIVIHGYGESNPLVKTADGVREPQNRRVEIILK